MNVNCPSCSTVFRVDPAKVPAAGVRARCSVCRAVFRVEAEAPATPTPPALAIGSEPPVQPRAVEPTPLPAHRAPEPVPMAAPAAAPPAAAPVPPAPAPMLPQAPAQPRPVVPRPPIGVPATFGGQAMPRPAAPSAPAVRPPFTSRPVSIAMPAAPRPAPPRPMINPFMSQDPGQKARRLARALVSDIVVYHPEKRIEGLRHGTLKRIFGEEIKKSYEEYSAQVGRELAESMPHFTDALNEILGDGTKIF